MHTYASMGNILPAGPEEEPPVEHMSPSKRGAAALEGSPMFTPLEVKFKNMSKFADSAKKNMSNNKYPTVDVRGDGIRIAPLAMEIDENMATPEVLRRKRSP